MDDLINLYDIISVVGIGLAFLTLFLIPSKRKIMAGQAGRRLDSPLLPVLIAILGIISLATIGFIFLRDYMIRSLVTGVLLFGASVFIFIEYRSVRKLLASSAVPAVLAATDLPAAPSRTTVPPGAYMAQETLQPTRPPKAIPQPQQLSTLPPKPGSMTVECPQCRAHLNIAVGSNTITCPHCGLSGTL